MVRALDLEVATALVEAMGHFGYALIIGRPDGQMLYVNEAWSQLTGVPLDELPLQPFGSSLAPEFRQAAMERNERRIAGLPNEEVYESGIVHTSGEVIPLDVGVRPIELDGEPALAAFMHDISVRKLREARIRVLEEAVGQMPIGIGIWRLPPDTDDPTDLVLVAANAAGAAIVDVDLAVALGKPMREAVPALVDTRLPELYLQAIRTGTRVDVDELRYRDAATGDAFYDVRIFPLPDNHVGTVFEEITERYVAAVERRLLLRRIVEVEEATRRRLAEELHDDPIQVLTALNLRLGLAKRQAADEGVDLGLDALEELAGTTIESLRRILFDLLPPGLAAGSLADAVATQAAALGNDLAVAVDVSVGSVEGVAPEVVAAGYRIVQEALANVRRHAKASHARVDIWRDDESLHIVVEDDGIGLPSGVGDSPGHIGVRSMRERAKGLDGWCVVEPVDGRGTRVRAQLPVTA